METFKIMLIKVNHRVQKAPAMQEVLTKYGCNIKVRLGMHETSDDSCSNEGLIILQLSGDDAKFEKFLEELNDVEGVTAKLAKI